MKKLHFALLLAGLFFSCAKESELVGTAGKSGSITRFAIFQDFMYVLNLNEVQTYRISKDEKPVLVHELPTDYGLETITIFDGTIFLGSTTALYILDISAPAAPTLISKSDRLADFGFSGCDPVVVQDNFAYSTIKIIENICGLVSAESALIVYDISDKSAPKAVGQYPMDIPNGLAIKGNHLFICDEGRDQLVIFDISKPEELVETAFTVQLTDPRDLIVDGEKLIVSTKTDFQIFDINDLTQIKKLGRISK